MAIYLNSGESEDLSNNKCVFVMCKALWGIQSWYKCDLFPVTYYNLEYGSSSIIGKSSVSMVDRLECVLCAIVPLCVKCYGGIQVIFGFLK